MRRKKPKKRITVKARVELERRFLGSIISRYSNRGDMREDVAYLRDRLGICWRNFRDKRHRALWRAFETLNIKSIEERMDIIESEIEAEVAEEFKFSPENVKMLEPEDRILMGGASQRYVNFKDRLIKDSAGLLWLERELEAAGAFPVVGGKVYLRKIAEIGKGELSPEHLAEGLFGISLPVPETKKECYDIFSGFSEEEVLYLESLKNSASAEDRKKFIEITDAKRTENEKVNKEVS